MLKKILGNKKGPFGPGSENCFLVTVTPVGEIHLAGFLNGLLAENGSTDDLKCVHWITFRLPQSPLHGWDRSAM